LVELTDINLTFRHHQSRPDFVGKKYSSLSSNHPVCEDFHRLCAPLIWINASEHPACESAFIPLANRRPVFSHIFRSFLMSPSHAVVWIDHQSAQVLQIDADPVQLKKVKAQTYHNTRQHGSNVRTEHEFFGEVCDALAGITEVLITGSNTAQADFRHYIDKHRASLTRQIVGWETVDHPTEPQLVALGRKYFLKHDRMAGTTALS
jgi:hypothetical protein